MIAAKFHVSASSALCKGHSPERANQVPYYVSPSHHDAVHKYILNQQEHHKKETFQEELLRILKKCGVQYDEQYLWN